MTRVLGKLCDLLDRPSLPSEPAECHYRHWTPEVLLQQSTASAENRDVLVVLLQNRSDLKYFPSFAVRRYTRLMHR